MSNGMGTAEASVRTCPDWCALDHDGADTFHTSSGKTVEDIYGKTVRISVFRDDNSGKSGVYVGEYGFDATHAAHAAYLLNDAVLDLLGRD